MPADCQPTGRLPSSGQMAHGKRSQPVQTPAGISHLPGGSADGPRNRSADELDDQNSGEQRGQITRDLVAAIPPWMISLSFHIVAIILLAIFAFQPNERLGTIDVLAQFEPNPTTESLIVEIKTEDENTPSDHAQPEMSSSASRLKSETESDLKSRHTQTWTVGDVMPAFDNLSHVQIASKSKSGDGTLKTGNADRGSGDGEATFYGIKAKGKTFVYVLDNSGSMAGIRWLQARNEVIRSINSLKEHQQFMVVLYNSHTKVMLGQRGKEIRCLAATKENRQKVIQWLVQRTPELDTLPLHSMKIAIRVQPDAIFLLSDGEFRDGTLEFLRKANFDREKQELVARQGQYYRATYCNIHTIAFKSFIGAPLLRQIANENNGTFKYVE